MRHERGGFGAVAALPEHHPEVMVIDDQRLVDEGRIITSAGVSAGIGMALNVIAHSRGSAVALQTARHMEYTWHP